MGGPVAEARSTQVLIHAPFGRDAALLRDVLQRAGIDAAICPNIDAVCAAAREGCAAILVGDEALSGAGIEKLRSVVSEQPPWSDIPILVMTDRREAGRRYQSLKQLAALGNVNFLDRPLRAETVVSNFKMALRARDRQYDIRDYLEAERRTTTALARANSELRRANEDLNQFAFSASHDLQEPLRMVAMFTQMLDREFGADLGPKAAGYMRYALQGAKRMEELLKDLQSYVQVVNATDEGSVLTDANEVLLQAVANLQSSIEATNAAIHCSALPAVLVKRIHLLQLFQNLIGNALKYHGKDTPNICISSERRNGDWRFNIRDNGIGIEPRYAQQIFGVFKRLHARDKYSGNGIGLAICQKIVERYGGRIWVESEGLGSGSLFSFTFPAVHEESGAPGSSDPGGG